MSSWASWIFGPGLRGHDAGIAGTAGPPENPVKLYIYGHLNRVQSNGRLEREAQRKVELMWLTVKLAPDHKIIANVRKDNGPAIGRPLRGSMRAR
jgi:transposase